ncbi:globin domain-containing protein [Salinispora fenicalii]|uniref:globin domain-containing protein n=1 Tax=Salinispora fenicalii TaxID=1137263 RepID=UPI000487478C|nr:globin domain-containing protein [Salinispora fenicalii]
MDVAALRWSWNRITAAGPRAAKHFYATLFVIAPETRTMFPTNMQHQEDKLLAALGHIITNIDNGDALTAFAHHLGADHRRFCGVDVEGRPVPLAERHYIWVGQALLATLADFVGSEWTPRLRDDWAAAYEFVAKLMLAGAAASERLTPPSWQAEVISVERRRSDVCVLTVRPNYLCNYLPGQSLPTQVPALRTWRYLSPANAPRPDGTLEFHVRATGRFSTHLVRRVAVGEVLRLGHPTGTALSAYNRAPHRPLLLIAGGTGVAPLRAIIEELQQGSGRPTTLVVGGKSPDDLYDHQALLKLAASAPAMDATANGFQPWLRYVPTVEIGWDWDGEVGRAADTALRMGPWRDADILVCGSPTMTQATIAALKASGIDPDRLLVERFDHSVYPPLAAADTPTPNLTWAAR